MDFFGKTETVTVENENDQAITKLSHRHHAIIDWLLANPDVKSLAPLAEEMNVTRPWLSQIMKSDVFREEFVRRRAELDSKLSAEIVTKQLKITSKALDKLDGVLDNDEVDDRLVLDVANKTAQALGFGPTRGNAPALFREREVIEEVTKEVTPGVLAKARRRMRSVEFFDAVPATDG